MVGKSPFGRCVVHATSIGGEPSWKDGVIQWGYLERPYSGSIIHMIVMGVGGGCTFNPGSHTVVIGRLYCLGMLNLCMDAKLDGEWEVIRCTLEIRNGWSKSIG